MTYWRRIGLALLIVFCMGYLAALIRGDSEGYRLASLFGAFAAGMLFIGRQERSD